MAKQDGLFELVRSLSANERRYFNLHASVHKNAKPYLQLFTALCKMENYSEEELCNLWKRKKIKTPLARVKCYLYDQILLVLKNFYRDSSIDNILMGYLTETEVLFNKGLYQQCATHIEKARKFETQANSKAFLLKLLQWEVKIQLATQHVDTSVEQMMDRLDTIDETLLNLQHYFTLNREYLQQHYSVFKESLNTSGIKQQFAEPPQSANVIDNNFEYAYLRNKYFEWRAIGQQNFADSLNYIFNNIELYNSNELQQKYGTIDICNLFENALIIASAINDTQRVNFIAAKLSSINGLDKEHRLKLTYKVYYAQLVGMVKGGGFESALGVIKTRGAQLQGFEHCPAGVRLAILNVYSNIYHAVGDYNNCLYCINTILNDKSIKETPIIYVTASFYHVIVHYDLNNFMLLDSVLHNYKRNIKKMVYYDAFDRIFINGLSRAIHYADKQERAVVLGKIKERLGVAISQGEIPSDFILNFDIFLWLDSKITGRPYIQLVKEQATAQ